jgi:hypothetical protein
VELLNENLKSLQVISEIALLRALRMDHDVILRGVEDINNFPMRSSLFDAVIVPGGGLRQGGALPAWVENRLDKALHVSPGSHIITLSAGTPHKPPPLDQAGNPILECAVEAAWLRDRGYPPTLLLMENASYDTIGNAYFARVMHVDPAGFRRLCIITSEFHMPRTEAIFRWVFALTPVTAAYELTFVAVPDVGMTTDVVEARRRKEQVSLESLGPLRAEYNTLASFHRWLFTKHAAYALEKPLREKADSLLLETY